MTFWELSLLQLLFFNSGELVLKEFAHASAPEGGRDMAASSALCWHRFYQVPWLLMFAASLVILFLNIELVHRGNIECESYLKWP